MTENISIGDAELEIMKVLWKSGEPINSHDIGVAVEHKGWKRTTIATFLARLVEKGVVAIEKRGNANYYSPLITAKEYKRSQVKNMVKNVFDGSVNDLVASLFNCKSVSDEDIKELKAIIDNKEE